MTTEQKSKVIQFLRQGYPQKTACARSRVHYTDFLYLVNNDSDFRLDVQEAEAIGICDQIDSLKEASYGDYKAALAFLERRNKEEFGQSVKIDLAVDQGRQEVLAELKRRLPTDLYKQVIEYLAK